MTSSALTAVTPGICFLSPGSVYSSLNLKPQQECEKKIWKCSWLRDRGPSGLYLHKRTHHDSLEEQHFCQKSSRCGLTQGVVAHAPIVPSLSFTRPIWTTLLSTVPSLSESRGSVIGRLLFVSFFPPTGSGSPTQSRQQAERFVNDPIRIFLCAGLPLPLSRYHPHN
ncbi:hypothetical protein SKAU_G00296800 [Synaphobranchus kaupii]|uniref:Uncharacterized protein n=1 Tax=Synaphobranchus kaupii TaxID=118154 RepID=A0A9Q1EUV3_SYNKA|nr:hypothetical protein SKAU_G00296800 [Synaphobranchus kaupii]